MSKCGSPMGAADLLEGDGCTNEAGDYHTCPFSEEVDEEEQYCTCCVSCTEECAQAI